MKTKLSVCLLFLIISSSCGDKRGSDIATQESEYAINIDLVGAMSNQKDIKLSEIADSIAYIPLEFVKDYPVGRIMDYKVFSDNIFIQTGGENGGFLRFDGKGKFMNTIGTKGRGPGEYPLGSIFSATDNPERFYILCNFVPRRVLEYGFDGNFLSQVMVADPAVGKFEAISPERFLLLASGDTSFHNLAKLTDRNNKSLSKAAHPLLSNPKLNLISNLKFIGARSGSYYGGMPIFWDEISMDTVFSVMNDEIYPRYILDKGNLTAPFEKVYSYPEETYKIFDPNYTPESWDYLYPFGFSETMYDVFISALYKNRDLYLFNYNKTTHALSHIKTQLVIPDDITQPASGNPEFENDIDGGISLGPGKPNIDGDIWTYTFDAINFKNQLTKEYFLDSKALYPEKKEALMRLVDNVKDEDNPIIMVVYLKKSPL